MDKSKENEELNRKVHELRGECLHIKETVIYEDHGAVCGSSRITRCKKCHSMSTLNKDYPGNIAHAGELVEEMKEKGYIFSLMVENKHIGCMFAKGNFSDGDLEYGEANNETAPTAICLAYVEVMGNNTRT